MHCNSGSKVLYKEQFAKEKKPNKQDTKLYMECDLHTTGYRDLLGQASMPTTICLFIRFSVCNDFKRTYGIRSSCAEKRTWRSSGLAFTKTPQYGRHLLRTMPTTFPVGFGCDIIESLSSSSNLVLLMITLAPRCSTVSENSNWHGEFDIMQMSALHKGNRIRWAKFGVKYVILNSNQNKCKKRYRYNPEKT